MSYAIEEYIDELVELRHTLHTIPEVAGEENQTAKKITKFLKKTGPDDMVTGIGGNGMVASYNGKEDGPTVMIRCELDGLPIAEENDMEYKSTHEGKGHKCGHDGHMAILCGVAKWLGKERPEKGNVQLLLQPAEETGEGAAWMLDDKAFKKFEPDCIFALHNVPGFEKHQIICREGVFAAASEGFIVHFKGATAHAAQPEEGKSPALAMAQLVQTLSALPQFHAPLDKAAKVTVVQAHLGEPAFGISPGEATVMATVRTYDDKLLKRLKKQAEKYAKGIAKTYGLKVKTQWTQAFKATVNEEEPVNIIQKAAEKHKLNYLQEEVPFAWSEDFGRFTDAFSGAMFGLGSGKDHPELHAGDYDFPDEIIETGVKMFMEIIGLVVSHES